MSDFCQDLSTTSCNKAIIIFEYSVLVELDYSRALSRTFIHCSAWGRGADSSTAGDASTVTVLGSSLSQDRSVDFLHNTNLVASQARLPSYVYYSGMVSLTS
jgi:hypothetical protein